MPDLNPQVKEVLERIRVRLADHHARYPSGISYTDLDEIQQALAEYWGAAAHAALGAMIGPLVEATYGLKLCSKSCPFYGCNLHLNIVRNPYDPPEPGPGCLALQAEGR